MENDREPGRPTLAVNPLLWAATALWRHRWIVALAVVVGCAVGLFSALTVPDQYRSVGKLFVRPGVRDLITPEAAFSGTGGGATRVAGAHESVQNAMQVLTAPQLYEKVVEHLGADVLLAPFVPPQNADDPLIRRLLGAFQAWWFGSEAVVSRAESDEDGARIAATMLANNVVFLPDPGASVIMVIYSAHSPDLARKVVNAVLDAATQVHKDIFNTMSPLANIEMEMKNAELAAGAAERVLREFQEKKGIFDYASQRDALLARTLELDRRVDALDVEVNRKTAERELVKRLCEAVPAVREVRSPSSFAVNPSYAGLTSFLQQLQLAEIALDAAATEARGSPDAYKTQKNRLTQLIQDTNVRLGQEGIQLKLDAVVEENPNHARLKAQLDDLDVALKGLAAERERLEAQRTSIRLALTDFGKLAPDLAGLELVMKQTRAIADNYAAGVESMRTVQRLEKLNFMSVQVLHGATFEPERVLPRRSRTIGFGAVGGTLAGCVIAMLLAFLDPKVRDRVDLLALGVPGESCLVSSPTGRRTVTILPAELESLRGDIDRLWTSVPYDRRAAESLKIALVPCGHRPDAGAAAAALAAGLTLHAGERVVLVACAGESTWLARRLGIDGRQGWRDVMAGRAPLESAVVASPIAGLSVLLPGADDGNVDLHIGAAAFLELLDRLGERHRFVVLELPGIADVPAVRSVLAVIDGVELVARQGGSRKQVVRDAIAATRRAGAQLLGAVLQPVEAPPVVTATKV